MHDAFSFLSRGLSGRGIAMKRILLLGLPVIGLLVLPSCENTFNPKGPYTQELVIYSILTTRSDTQYVRVYTTYNPSGFNPLEITSDTDVRGARVTIASGDSTYVLRDTTITRVDQSRYSSGLGAYIAYPMPIVTGRSYSLQVASDQGAATATVTVPGKGTVVPNNQYVLKEPGKYSEDIAATIYMSPITVGYVIRLYVDFEYVDGGTLVRMRTEVPVRTSGDVAASPQFTYPRLTRRDLSRFVPIETIYFPLDAYEFLLSYLKVRYSASVELRSATFILTQVDNNLYKYYNVVNGFQDAYSIRTDSPDYTNIRGGLGVFGAMVEDSTVVDLPAQ
jgi:hypothetical protein